MKYNLKLSKPQTQQLKDVLQKTAFDKIDSSWRVFTRIVTGDTNSGLSFSVNVGDFVYSSLSAASMFDAAYVLCDANNKVIIFDYFIKSNLNTGFINAVTNTASNLYSNYNIETLSGGGQANPKFPTIINQNMVKQYDVNLYGRIKNIGGESMLPSGFSFSQQPVNLSFTFCEIELLTDWFYASNIVVPDEAYVDYYDSESGVIHRYDYVNYTGTIGGESKVITTIDSSGNPTASNRVNNGKLGVLNGNTFSAITDETIIGNFRLVTRTVDVGDLFDSCGTYCGRYDYPQWSTTSSSLVSRYIYDEYHKKDCTSFTCIARGSNGLYAFFKRCSYQPDWNDCPDISSGGGGGVAHQVNVAHSGYIGSYTIADNISLSTSGNTLTLSFDTRTMTEEQVTYLSNS